ncbi:MAG: PSD1 domain-containing protein [Planctomycetales bacterium]|nr:PSD1 domain-containing protein [Planctomycetales bacterium]
MQGKQFVFTGTFWLVLTAWLYSQSPNQQISEEEAPATPAERLFATVVSPTLEAKCVACHGNDEAKLESNLRVDSLERMLLGGDSGQTVLEPGDRQASWLYLSLTWQHEDLRMPPKENDRLTDEVVEAIGQWIDWGAPWVDEVRAAGIRSEEASGVTVTTSGGMSAAWNQRHYDPADLWAYQPLVQPLIPDISTANPIDCFIAGHLEQVGIKAASRAARRDLIRRLYFDVLGLPPSPEQVYTFESDPRPDEVVWNELVDRCLASPAYGERWAQHWLDTIRYADSSGFANDYQRPNTWRYRDYLVRNFNLDRPLSEMIRQQLAGDELNSQDPENLIAVGMLRMGPWEQTGMSVDRVTRQMFLDDVTDLIGQAFLAHPLQCARCHDHKFDPIPSRDYYAMQAVFSTTQFSERPAEFLPEENQHGCKEQSDYLSIRIDFFQTLLDQLDAKEEQAARDWYAERGWNYAPRAAKLKAGEPEERIAPKKIGFTPADFGLERIARKYLERHRWEMDRYDALAFSVYDGPTPPRRGVSNRLDIPSDIPGSGEFEKTAILAGGDPFSPTETVVAGTLSVLSRPGMNPQFISTDFHLRRSEFADWLLDANRNPLTPRVLVNRLWQHHFGKGIVATPNNFGTMGSKPTHPALLDFLATEFVRSNWSQKHIHRLILTSDAYCRTSQIPTGERDVLASKDPLGTSYATFTSRRLSAEELLDGSHAISGLLNREIGGVPVCPDINQEVAEQPRQIMGTYAPIYQPSPVAGDRYRRNLYALRLRGLRDPLLEVFNQPASELSCELRDESTVAPQALTLINSPLAYNRALAMAERLLHEEDSRDEPGVIRRAFALAYSRQPSADELEGCVNHWRKMKARHERIQLPDVRPPREVTREFVDENTGEVFSFTEPLEQNRDYQLAVEPSTASAQTRGLADVCQILMASNEFLFVP